MNNSWIKILVALSAVGFASHFQSAQAQESAVAPAVAVVSQPVEDAQAGTPELVPPPPDETAVSEEAAKPVAPAAEPDYEDVIRRAEMEKAQAEAERARWEAEKAKAEAQKAKIEAERANQPTVMTSLSPQGKPEPDPGSHRHDGFFVRLLTGPGVGFHSGSGTIDNGDVGDYSGTAYAMWNGQLALGAAVVEDLIVYAAFWGNSAFVSDNSYEKPKSSIGGYGGLNLGINYYLMPANVFVGGEIGSAFGSYRVYDSSDWSPEYYNYDPLFGFDVKVLFGKEWWVSDNWGLGLAVSGSYTYLAYGSQHANLGGVHFNFSATYN
jgi:hypothetical protein